MRNDIPCPGCIRSLVVHAHSAVKRAFEIDGYPRPILVNGEGKIVAVDNELRDGKLLEVLAEVFGKDS